MHLQLFYFAAAVNVVGDGVPPSVRMCRNEIPSETDWNVMTSEI
jgi:hypothetical protein